MKLYSENKEYKLYHGNMLDMLEEIEKDSIDSIVCDPPYELNFMNKGWDNSGIAFNLNTWKQCYEVLKPGGYLLAFGGSRTYHRIACAIEDAGFEIRDTIMWLYGSGFPKSMALDKSIEAKLTTGSGNKKDFFKCNGILEESKGKGYTSMKATNVEQQFRNINYESKGQLKLEPTTNLAKKYRGWGTALKPAFEPIIVARKPFKGSCIDNVIKYGVGGINIDECRVGTEERKNPEAGFIRRGRTSEEVFFGTDKNRPKGEKDVVGRFPSNVILTYDDTDFNEVCGGFPNTNGGKRHNTFERKSELTSYGMQTNTRNEFNDSGSASRYFYCAKASKKDRDEGLEEFNDSKVNDGRETSIDNAFQRGETPRKNTHPTVKPTQLMQYLVRLVTPKNGTVLDPFNGSGSTGKAVMYENKERNANYKYIGIELTEEYLPIAKARIEYVSNLQEEKLKDIRMTIDDYMEE